MGMNHSREGGDLFFPRETGTLTADSCVKQALGQSYLAKHPPRVQNQRLKPPKTPSGGDLSGIGQSRGLRF